MAILLPGTGYTDNISYSTFTMDLVFGHHLADRRASQEIRLFKYADRGFGLRVLPSYAKSLEDNLQKRLRNTSAEREGDCPFWQMNRKPEGAVRAQNSKTHCLAWSKLHSTILLWSGSHFHSARMEMAGCRGTERALRCSKGEERRDRNPQ